MPVTSRHGFTRCPSCRAHVRAAELRNVAECPFCDARVPRARVSRSRSALLAGSLLAFSTTGCGGPSANQPDEDSQQQPPPDDGIAEPMYGEPPDDVVDQPMYGEPSDD